MSRYKQSPGIVFPVPVNPKQRVTTPPISPLAQKVFKLPIPKSTTTHALLPTQQQLSHTQFYCAIDIEMGGPIITKHPLVRIGIAVVDENAVTWEKAAFPIPFCREDFDPETTRRFWSNEIANPGISKLLDLFEYQGGAFRNPVTGTPDIATALKRFVDYFDYIHSKYENVVLVGDFIEYDYGVLNTYVGQYLNRPLLNYYSNRVRYPLRVHSTSTFYHTVCAVVTLFSEPSEIGETDNIPSGRKKALELLGVKIPNDVRYDHNPENDAEQIVATYVIARRAWGTFCRDSENFITARKNSIPVDVLVDD